MCIMEVRAGQRSSTIAQACAHNATTVERDLDMFCELLERRGDTDRLVTVRAAQRELQAAYAGLLTIFGEFVAEEETEHGQHHHHDDGTHERSFVEQAHHDAGLARRFETR